MKVRIAIGVIAVLALAGCGGKDNPAAEATAAASSAPTSSSAPSQATSTPAAAPAVPAKGEKPNKQFLVGKWGTNGDCALAIELRPDGTSDGPFGNWTYTDGVIGFVDEPDFKVSVTVIDDATMQSTNGDGKTSTMTRCP